MNEQQDDKQLLLTFAAQGDESAFAELMRRHGGVVRTAARNVVGSASMAEDIVQATFLALARKARSLGDREGSLAGWLYRVATCLARNARRDEIRRTAREKEVAMLAVETDTDTSPTLGEAALAALYEELGNLAEKYRQPVILHHLQGLSYETAAPLCGCNGKTFSMRLTRGREKLRERLAKRGVALGITALIAGLSQTNASAAELPAVLVASTCQAATAVAAGGSVAGGGLVSAKVAALTDSALKLLFWGQVKTVAVVCAGIAVLGGAGLTLATMLPHSPHPEARKAAVVAPSVSARANAAAASEYEDGAILFQDSFENGFANWDMYTRNGPEDEGSEVTNSPNIRIVHVARDSKTCATVEFDKQSSGWPRDCIVSKHITVPAVSAYSITYEYSFTDHPRFAMEGIETHMSGPPSATLLAPGSWNRVRWECVPETTNSVEENGTVSLFVNGEPFGKAEPLTVSARIGVVLEVIEGRFRFSNVVIREMQKKPQSQGLDAKERDIRIRQDTTVVKTRRKQS